MTERGDRALPRKRLIIFAALLGAIALALVVQLVRLTIVLPSREGGAPVTLPEVQRGSILDRQGRILAITTRVHLVSVWTPTVTDAEETATLLAQVLGMDKQSLVDTIRTRDGYAVLKRRISEKESADIAKLQGEGKLAGVRIEGDFGRLYPQGRMASHLVGWVGSNNVPLGGIEYAYGNELAPQPVGTDTDTVYGDQVFLTLDLDIQAIVDRVARAAMQERKPDSLMILVMDAPSGEILGYTSLPDFDPNELTRGTPSVDPSSTSNRPVTMAYEPGSVFKIFTLSGLLDMGAIKATDTFDDSGPYERKFPSGETVHIGDISWHGFITPQQIIQFSSNVGAAHASDQADKESFFRMVQRFGFGRQTGIPLQGETAGILNDVSRWSGRTKTTMVFGQEISVSAMQMVAAATAIANGGVLLKPHIVKKIVSAQGNVLREFTREPVSDVISPDSAASMLQWMETAVSTPNGTARRAAVDGVRISAKTGTAQVRDPKTRLYSDSDFIASLLGIFPTDRPRYIVYVVLENPRGQSYYGSVIAAPIFHDVAVGLVDQQGMSRTGTVAGTMPAVGTPPAAGPVQVGAAMPDLLGTPKKLLLPLLLRRDIDVAINGSGFVATQDPPAGTQVAAGMKIVLEAQVSVAARNREALQKHHPGALPAAGPKEGSRETRLQILPTPSGEPTLSVDGISYHSRYDPWKDALLAAEREVDSSATAIIVIGFGLGYGAQAARRRHPRTPLLVVEPDREVFEAALASRDLADFLADDGVTLFLDTPEGLPRVLESLPLARPVFLRLRPAFQHSPLSYRAVEEVIQSWLLRKDINTNTLARFGRLWVRNLCRNMRPFAESPGVGALAGLFAGIPALVVAGGPTLDALLPLLPAIRERTLVVAVNTPLRPCIEAGVEPDFTVVVDPQFWASRYLDWTATRRGCLVAEPSTCPRVFRREDAPFFFCSSLFPLGETLEEATGHRGALGAGGSVATSAWDLARLLGCRPLYAAGLDLGFPGMRTHCRGVYVEDTWMASTTRLDPLEGRSARSLRDIGLFPTRSTGGGLTQTDRRMLLYKWWFENQLAMRPDSAAFTLSADGTAIDGMPWVDPAAVLALPERRAEIDAAMESVRTVYEERPRMPAAAAPLRTALAKVQAGLEHLEALAQQGLEETRHFAEALERGTDSGPHVRALDAIDEAILGVSARTIAGFLIQSVIHRIAGEGEASTGRLQVVERSRAMYEGIADSAHWQKGLLARAARDLGED